GTPARSLRLAAYPQLADQPQGGEPNPRLDDLRHGRLANRPLQIPPLPAAPAALQVPVRPFDAPAPPIRRQCLPPTGLAGEQGDPGVGLDRRGGPVLRTLAGQMVLPP